MPPEVRSPRRPGGVLACADGVHGSLHLSRASPGAADAFAGAQRRGRVRTHARDVVVQPGRPASDASSPDRFGAASAGPGTELVRRRRGHRRRSWSAVRPPVFVALQAGMNRTIARVPDPVAGRPQPGGSAQRADRWQRPVESAGMPGRQGRPSAEQERRRLYARWCLAAASPSRWSSSPSAAQASRGGLAVTPPDGGRARTPLVGLTAADGERGTQLGRHDERRAVPLLGEPHRDCFVGVAPAAADERLSVQGLAPRRASWSVRAVRNSSFTEPGTGESRTRGRRDLLVQPPRGVSARCSATLRRAPTARACRRSCGASSTGTTSRSSRSGRQPVDVLERRRRVRHTRPGGVGFTGAASSMVVIVGDEDFVPRR